MSAGPPRGRSAALAAILSVLALAGLGVATTWFAARPGLRIVADATKTRAYSLSPQTERLLRGLEGDWTIALFIVESETDASVRRQIDEVVRRFRDAAPNLDILRIDPADPRSLLDYETAIDRLQSVYADESAAYDGALDDGEAAFETLVQFAADQATSWQVLTQALAADPAAARTAQQRVTQITLLAAEGWRILEEVRKARRADAARPTPDYETARTILATALSEWGSELFAMATSLREWSADPRLPADLRAALDAMVVPHESQSRAVVAAADPLRRLPSLELSAIGRSLEQGEAAVVIGPDRAAVIPASQLLPAGAMRSATTGVRFDQRFRGEQAIAAALRSLLVDQMPLIVFMHAESSSLLAARDGQSDLTGARDMLEINRFEVAEWPVAEADAPVPAPGQPVVWIVVPPTQRRGLDVSDVERTLIDETRRLIERGEPVLLNLFPSQLPRFGQPDPWRPLLAQLEIAAETDRVVVESVRAGEETRLQKGVRLTQYNATHPIGEAADGQTTFLGLPIPLRPESAARGTAFDPILSVTPLPRRWIEPDWMLPENQIGAPDEEDRFDEPVPVVLALERTPEMGTARQRLLVSGSGGWLLTFAADPVVNLGGERVALAHPGNYELMLASAAWLAGMDDLIARSPTSRQTARLDGVTPDARRRWLLITLLLMPFGALALGVLVHLVRRV